METLTKRNKKYEEYIQGLKDIQAIYSHPLNNYQKRFKNLYWFLRVGIVSFVAYLFAVIVADLEVSKIIAGAAVCVAIIAVIVGFIIYNKKSQKKLQEEYTERVDENNLILEEVQVLDEALKEEIILKIITEEAGPDLPSKNNKEVYDAFIEKKTNELNLRMKKQFGRDLVSSDYVTYLLIWNGELTVDDYTYRKSHYEYLKILEERNKNL